MCFGFVTAFVQRHGGLRRQEVPTPPWANGRRRWRFFFFFVFHFPLLCEPECRSDCVADRSFKTALNACAAPVDHGRPSWLPIPKACTSISGPSCSKHIARYIALFGSLSAGEEFLNIGHLRTHTKKRLPWCQVLSDVPYTGLWTENERWLGRFFGFSPKCRSVSVGFENKTLGETS